MTKKLNVWAFIFSIISIFVFFLHSVSGAFYLDWDINPLNLLLSFTVINFLAGVLGLSGIESWKGMVRSVTTIILTLGLTIVIIFITFIGSLAS